VNENAPLSFNLSASDADNDTLTYSSSALPTGATLVGASFSWTPASGAAGTYNLTFTVSDGKGGSDFEAITITVAAVATGNKTTAGSLSLTQAIENIGVISSFSGDANSNNQAVLEYRKVGDTQWKPGIAMTVDRRDNLVLYGSGTIANAYKNQWRAVIFSLTPDTSYEVRVTYSDADSVVGTNPITGTITTLNDNPASTGKTYYVAKTGNNTTGDGSEAKPWLTISKAASMVAAGDTVLIKPGTYTEQVALSKSGTTTNYVTFQSFDPNNKAVVIYGEYYTIDMSGGNYNRIRNLEVRNTAGRPCIAVGNSAKGNIVEDSTLVPQTSYWWSTGVSVTSGATNTLIQRNTISTPTSPNDGFGILLYDTGGGTVIRDNTITGSFYDGIEAISQLVKNRLFQQLSS